MKRVLTIVCALALLAAGTASAQIEYGFTVSASNTDGRVNSGPTFGSGGPVSIHLWMDCSRDDGIAAAEFSLDFDGAAHPGMFGWAVTMFNGWLNAGTTQHLLLAVGGCPTGPVHVATWAGFNTGAPLTRNFCLVASPAGNKVGVDCSPTPSTWPVKSIGLAAGVPPNCAEELCPPVSVEADTWGSIKSLYR